MPAKESDIIKIARYLDTTVEYLTDQTDDPSNTPPEGFVETENMRWNPYYDEEAVSAALKLATRPQGQILFSALKTASDEDIKKTIAILKALKGEE